MKRIASFLIALFLFTNLSAQTVNDIPIKDVDVEYVQIVGTAKLFSTKVTIQIDFGQSTTLFTKATESQIKDKDGKRVEFNSMIDALNFMAANGYDFVDAYVISIAQQNVYHYMMRKRH
jgi:hypothetical protein